MADSVSKASEDRQAKRLGEMQDALKRLQAMPMPRQLAKQDSMSKIALLKKRLEALKAMLQHASPEQAKALSRELKDIAKELSAVAKSLGGGPQGVTSAQAGSGQEGSGQEGARVVTEVPPVGPASTSVSEANGSDIGVGQGIDRSTGTGATFPSASTGLKAEGGQPGKDGGDSGVLAALQEAKRLLKEAIAMLKAKLTLAGGEARASKEEKRAKHDVESAEKSVAEMEQAMAVGGGEFYSALGGMSAGSALNGLAAFAVASGLNVDVSA